jgi:hypothetical protein
VAVAEARALAEHLRSQKEAERLLSERRAREALEARETELMRAHGLL